MRIQPVYSNVYCNNNPRARKATNSNINYKGIPTTLILLAAKEGVSAIKSRHKVRYLVELEECLNSNDAEKFIAGAKAMSKTPDSYYDLDHQGWAFWTSTFMGKDPDYVNNLRRRYLLNIDKISDNNHFNLQVKKDFITSLFENGHEISHDLIKQFQKLKDSLYKSFKEETVDTAFFSARYNQKRIDKFWLDNAWGGRFEYAYTALPNDYTWQCEPFNLDRSVHASVHKREICSLTVAFDNLKLASTLDKNIYRSYLNSRRGRISQHQQILENYFNKVRASGSEPPPETYKEYVMFLKTI